MEIFLEYRVQEYLVPRHPVLLLQLQHTRQEILSQLTELRVYLQRLGLDILHQLILVLSEPWQTPVQHLIEYKPD